MENLRNRLRSEIAGHPFTTLAITFAAGWLAGMLLTARVVRLVSGG
jgi:ElaB/YqjD/DUF883 family membrane-anchored ribosome-binding protein